MARLVDPEKIKKIEEAVMELIVEHGYSAISVSAISKKAGVSEGYLYRYYTSKEELVIDLIESEFDSFVSAFRYDIANENTLFEVAVKTIQRLFMSANDDPTFARFTALVVLENRILAKARKGNYKKFFELASECIALGMKTGEINTLVTPLEVLVVSFTIPFRYLSVSLEIEEAKKFTEEEAKRIAKICIQALK